MDFETGGPITPRLVSLEWDYLTFLNTGVVFVCQLRVTFCMLVKSDGFD